eukprot:CAMPEP_0117668334 /NCGR_PEP_ID=MMETSP0804-20121206/11489_1 /TAXON_ID=1074897 /ORGANISM="Tetraselmis astigmatica, Strain CCMP880" /LENGTH=386 /DNA_ID=CAMNT_0005476209 /DNA_START=600 /DNA_END=1760 /DNA_ORIENTATION=+
MGHDTSPPGARGGLPARRVVPGVPPPDEANLSAYSEPAPRGGSSFQPYLAQQRYMNPVSSHSFGGSGAGSTGSLYHGLLGEATAPSKADHRKRKAAAVHVAPAGDDLSPPHQQRRISDDSNSAGDTHGALFFRHLQGRVDSLPVRRTISQNTAPVAFASAVNSVGHFASGQLSPHRVIHPSWTVEPNQMPRPSFRGVTRSHDGKHFVAYVTCMGMSTFAGRYDSEVEAAAAHDRALVQVLGATALPHLNFPSPAAGGGIVAGMSAFPYRAEPEDGPGSNYRTSKPAAAVGEPARVQGAGAPGKRNSSYPAEFQKSSQYRGVSWNKKDKKWQSMIFSRGRAMWLGYFKEEEDAARAYDKAAVREKGAKAKLNFPESASQVPLQTAST